MESLKIIPLGGLGEFGLNMMLVEYGDAAIAVDCGVMFPTADLLGIEHRRTERLPGRGMELLLNQISQQDVADQLIEDVRHELG